MIQILFFTADDDSLQIFFTFPPHDGGKYLVRLAHFFFFRKGVQSIRSPGLFMHDSRHHSVHLRRSKDFAKLQCRWDRPHLAGSLRRCGDWYVLAFAFTVQQLRERAALTCCECDLNRQCTGAHVAQAWRQQRGDGVLLIRRGLLYITRRSLRLWRSLEFTALRYPGRKKTNS